jgi:glutamate dehydrogenase
MEVLFFKGNGMLLSKRIKLVAAFNHMHVFIDPNPNPLTSYDERSRLFKLPYSTWNDYNRELISEGGGIWSRKEKSIAISKQVAELLDIPNTISSLSPDELIRYCLKARADLLWNGGIGTFFKGENESHEDAADKSNDNIRINGGEVRARVVGEGGNLGFTQLSRVELARKGGKINTDFIDNSAGVSCSGMCHALPFHPHLLSRSFD